MIDRLAENTALFFARKKLISADDVDIYIYGLQMIFISALNWGLILLIMLLARRIPETLLYIAAVILLRHHTGGYHADAYYKCGILSVCSYLAVLAALYVFSCTGLYVLSIIPALISAITIYTLAPIVHPNNPGAIKDIRKHKLYSRILFLLLTAAAAALFIFRKDSLALSILLGIFQVSVLLLVEHIRQGKEAENNVE